MAAIRFGGLASGLPPNIVDQLMEAERIPVKQMEEKKKKSEDTLKLVTDMETKLNDIGKSLGDLTTAKGFTDTQLNSSEPSVIDGKVDPNTVVNGEYGIEVIQMAQKPAAISNGFKDKNVTQMGTGYIKFETSQGLKEVYISGKNSTLEGVVNQINNSNAGVRASILEDKKDKDNPFRLLVSGLQSGDEKTVSFPTVYMLDGDQDMYFDQSRPAQNGKIKVDGFEVEVSENQLENIIPGVTLNLKQAAPGKEIRLSVKENTEAVAGKIKAFVDAYNGALGFIQGQSKLQKDASGKDRLGPLGGDSLTRTVESSLRRVLLNPQIGTGSGIARISELGIEFNRNGTLNFTQEKFQRVLNSNPKDVAAFFRGDGSKVGFVPTVKREIGNLTNGVFGTIGNRKKGISDRIEQTNRRIDDKERQLVRKEESLRRKFADLESKMSKLNSQGAAFQGMSQGLKQDGQQGG